MLSKDNINKIKEAIIIEGPDDVLNSSDENSPNNTCLLYTSPSPRD